MSLDLVKQALELVDPEGSSVRRSKRGAGPARAKEGAGRVYGHPKKQQNKKSSDSKTKAKSKQQISEENIEKLLELSKPVATADVREQIVKRAVKGKPLLERIEVKKDDEKSIFFPEEPAKKRQSFRKFEKQYFCS